MKTSSIERHKKELTEIFEKTNRFAVFLCGPSVKNKTSSAAKLRMKFSRALKRKGFEVVVGEDDGMDKIARLFDLDAQSNEIKYIEQCSAIIIIADSPGSFSELGSFTHHLMKSNQQEKNKIDFILVIHKQYKGKKSYINHGPALLVKNCLGGMSEYVDFNKYKVSEIVKRLSHRRAAFRTLKK